MTATEIKAHNEYTVGWVCALPKEQTAATAMLDERHDDLPKPPNDSNTYTLGSIGKHNVVIACLPKGHIGNNPAATVAAQMVSTFPSIRFGLMVGIGGGIPPKVRLGDVVVSTPVGNFPGVVQWDRGKTKDDSFERTGSLNNPPASLLTALAKLETEHELVGSKIPEYLDQMNQKWPRLAAKYLKTDSLEDILFKASYSHVCQSTAEDRVSSGSSYESEEEESCQHCDKTRAIRRKPRDMRVHYGLIASGNQVIKSATFRDQLNKDLGGNVLCVEMEAAGLMNNFPCVIIRGICDYADSHKNKDWQEYAAAVAAAFAKELLDYVQGSDVDGERTIKDVIGDVLTEVSSTKVVVSYLKSSLDNDIALRILEWVTSIDYSPQQSDFLRRREPGTGQWLIDSTEYQDWLGAKKQTLFCTGIPGAGKTILTSIVVDHLERTHREDPTIGIAYIYCNYRRQEEQSIERLLTSLLKQLGQTQNSLLDCLRDCYREHIKKGKRPNLDEIQKVLRKAVEAYSTVFIVVDALDECQNSDGSRQKFLTELFSLQEKSGCNLFMTSRVIPEIVDRFNNISISLEIRASTEDIKRYLKGNTGQLPAFVQQSQELQQMIAAEISKAVDGMFLLAQIYLNSLNDKMTPKAIKNALSSFQRQNSRSGETQKAEVLAHAYEQAMLRINGQQSGFKELARKVLSWVVCAEQQLTTTELQHALAVEIDESELDKENIPSIHDMVSVCAGLVTVDNKSNIIRLVHYTAQEYFNQTRKRWFPDADSIMADTCAAYLLLNAFQSEPCPSSHDLFRRQMSNPFYRYAAYNWGHHARKASKLCHKVMEFLEYKEKTNASVEGLRSGFSSLGLWDIWDQTLVFGMTSLHLGAYFGIEEAVKALLEITSDVNTKDTNGSTPISIAAQNGYDAVVKLLLLAGADPNIGNKDGPPLSKAIEKGHETVVKLLLATPGINVDARGRFGNTPLLIAAQDGDATVIELLLAAGAKPNVRNRDGHTPLLYAIMKRREGVVKLLLTAGADPELRNKRGITPLLCAAYAKSRPIMELLLTAGAKLDRSDKAGKTPLIQAAHAGCRPIVELLLTAGAKLNRNDIDGATPLLHAVNKQHVSVVELLLAAGANRNLRTKSGETPLWYAADNQCEAVVEMLLAAGADPNLGDEDGTTPLLIAAYKGCESIVKSLLAAGADPNLGDKDGTPLLIAAGMGYKSIMELLLAAGANPDLGDEDDQTPLSYAVNRKHKDTGIVRSLLAAGANPDLGSEKSMTPLMWAACKGDEIIVELLLAAGANPDLGNVKNGTPLSLAQERGHEAVVKLLANNKGAKVDLVNKHNDTELSTSVESQRKRKYDEVE